MKIIQQIFTEHASEYIKRNRQCISIIQRKAVDSILKCRTGSAGKHIFVCPDCHASHITNSSCGNRHCPVCQNDKAIHWVYKQQLKQLPCTYFLATFTLPRQFHSIAHRYPDKVYHAMFNASSASLKTLEKDKRFVGCDLAGFFGILHTWGRQMQYHPHIHYVIAGGGLTDDRNSWVEPCGNFLVHVRALSAVFKGKFRDELIKYDLLKFIPQYIWGKNWMVHCKSVGNGQHTLKYLGAYVFRVAISNTRIIDYDGKRVTFKYYKVGSRRARICVLDVMEFIRRYLQHILPRGFMKVRHFGFLHSKCSVSINQIREMILILYDRVRKVLLPKAPKKFKPLLCDKCGSIMQWKYFVSPWGRIFSYS